MPKSSVAAILDRYGCVRTVVTHNDALRHHTRCDEICVVVPHLRVQEPIDWNTVPELVRLAEQALDNWIKNNRPNEPWKREACAMRMLRKLEHVDSKRALNLEHIAET